jgi:hypothetical protein
MIAWRADDGYEPGVSEIPKFSIKMMQKDTDLSEGIVSGMDYFWYDAVPYAYKIPEIAKINDWIGETYEVWYDDGEF